MPLAVEALEGGAAATQRASWPKWAWSVLKRRLVGLAERRLGGISVPPLPKAFHAPSSQHAHTTTTTSSTPTPPTQSPVMGGTVFSCEGGKEECLVRWLLVVAVWSFLSCVCCAPVAVASWLLLFNYFLVLCFSSWLTMCCVVLCCGDDDGAGLY